jgi:phosphoribosylaminoimidazolecarboxamide formyltransferase/IMP cyclohydrolase
MPQIRRALISVTDKSHLIPFAHALHELGIELISTGGTARALREAGIPVQDVSDVTGFPEMLDGRVKTMHPRIAGGVLAVRANADHRAALAAHDIPEIDLVCVNLYAFEKAAARNASLSDLIENIDIGGPTLIRCRGSYFAA